MVLSIGLVSALAVLSITIGGFQYITTDSFSGKQEGRERITNSIYGLLLILISIVFLGTIDSDLLKIRFGLSPVQINAGRLVGVEVQPVDPENKSYCVGKDGKNQQCDFENSLECEAFAKKQGIALNSCKSVNAISYCRNISVTKSTGGKTLGSTVKKLVCYTTQGQCEQANREAPLREKSACRSKSDFDEKGAYAALNKEIVALTKQKNELEKKKKEIESKLRTYKDTFFCNGKTCYPTKTVCLNRAGGSGPTPSGVCVPYAKKKGEIEGELEDIKDNVDVIFLKIDKLKIKRKNNSSNQKE